jgi:hypothetical protein
MNSELKVAAMIGSLFGPAMCFSQPASAGLHSDPCSLLTEAQASAVFGANVDQAKHVALRLCEWSAPDQPNTINAKKVTLVMSDVRAFG